VRGVCGVKKRRRRNGRNERGGRKAGGKPSLSSHGRWSPSPSELLSDGAIDSFEKRPCAADPKLTSEPQKGVLGLANSLCATLVKRTVGVACDTKWP
jgi:hypothetical protein